LIILVRMARAALQQFTLVPRTPPVCSETSITFLLFV
jgi:hypothetical protein